MMNEEVNTIAQRMKGKREYRKLKKMKKRFEIARRLRD